MSSSSRLQRCTIQNDVLIWADVSISEENSDCQNILAHLRRVIHDVVLCTDPKECSSIVNKVNDGKVFIILSAAFGQLLVPEIHDIKQLDAMYIFCKNKIPHETWFQKWPKIEGIFTSIKPICESLKKVVRQCDNDATPMSFISKSMITAASTVTSEQKTHDQLEPSYMYTMLFKEIILDIEEDEEKSLEDLTAYCHKKGIDDAEIDYFRSRYHEKTAVWWYTYESFLYRKLNYALRTLDMEAMIKMSFFIRNLHHQLIELYDEQSSNFDEFIVYRGQGLDPKDFQHLRHITGGLLAFNCFLSTSTKQQIALDFITQNLQKHPENIGVLFIMTIDHSKISASTTPFALIDEYSAVPVEQEILFSMHTVFRVMDIKLSDMHDHLWEVHLLITDDKDPLLGGLTTYMKNEIDGTGWHRMGKLMLKMGDFQQAELLYQQLFRDSTSDNEKAIIYHQLGCLKDGQGNYQEATTFYLKSVEIKRKSVDEDDPSLAPTYNNIAGIYKTMGNNSKALEYYEKSLQIREKSVAADDPLLATSYNNIGLMYGNMGDYSKALRYYEKAHRILENALPPTHPSLATSYNNIGLAHDNTGEYAKALQYFEKAHQIFEKALPSNHPSFATCYNNIGLVHNNMGDYKKALEYYKKAHQILELSLPANHLNVAASYNNIAGLYNNMGDYSKALEYYEKAHEIKTKALSPTQPDLALSYNNIGGVYYRMRQYSKALEYYEKACHIFETILPTNHPSVATSYSNIGSVYLNKGDHAKALEYYEKAHAIKEKVLTPTHPDLATSYGCLGDAYDNLGNYPKSLEFYEKALAIRQKSLPPTHPTIERSIDNVNYMKRKMRTK